MKKMVVVFLAVFGFTFFGSTCKAEGVRIQPWCDAQGPVYLQLTNHRIIGMIGLDVITLGYYSGLAEGVFKGKEVRLAVKPDYTMQGRIGDQLVAWNLAKKNGIGIIYGMQECTPLDGPHTN